MSNYEVLVTGIVTNFGGAENIHSVTNCMTRVRITPKDVTKVDLEALKSVPEVLGVVNAETVQIVVGPGKAKKVADELIARYDFAQGTPVDEDHSAEDWQLNKAAVKSNQPKSKLQQALQLITNIFIPLIPAIIAAGIFQGFGSLLGQLIKQGTLNGNFWEGMRIIFALIGTSFLGYFAIYTGINAAKQFKATEALGGMVGAMSIAAQIVEISTLLGLYNEETPLNSILTTGKGGIIGVILGVYILSRFEKAIRRVMPDVLDLIFTPVLSLLGTALVMVFLVMPVSGFVSDWLVAFLNLFIASSNPVISVLSGYILSAVFLPMVLLGLHHGLIPIYAIQLETMGGVTLFPVLAMAGAGQVGAAIAIYLMAKKQHHLSLQKVIAGALPAGFLGIGEPLIYGVTLPLGKPFITAGIGAGFGGAYAMLMNVQATAWGPSGLVATPLMIPSKIVHYLIGLVIAYIGGFIVTSIMMKPEDLDNA
ncbi:PTS transporter subunit EIIC [Tuanshanicoccus lijuaniae]|uniref:PTS transporter subunit EIIC n=1 Tax=Aerococcaceae bacterium zg-1292 TaxID=2774330 RepID=UPI001BD8F1F2|nr:PTS transporter subunit EIIC [Aerococcaceae bacterium zg-A91]MBS4457483.1 PTS transporter subunit EIIC [Aerococcaceae bacterium zg-BR33]